MKPLLRCLSVGSLLSILSCSSSSESAAGNAGAATGGASSFACPSNLPSDADCGAKDPSFSQEIEPLLAKRCLSCHFDGNDMSSVVLVGYENVKKNARSALSRVYGCKMPPLGAEPLSDAERTLLLRYFVCGAPKN